MENNLLQLNCPLLHDVVTVLFVEYGYTERVLCPYKDESSYSEECHHPDRVLRQCAFYKK